MSESWIKTVEGDPNVEDVRAVVARFEDAPVVYVELSQEIDGERQRVFVSFEQLADVFRTARVHQLRYNHELGRRVAGLDLGDPCTADVGDPVEQEP